PLERNRVEISIDLVEGAVAKIRQINIVGNQVFEDEELLDQFQLTTPKLFSFFTKSDQYAKQKLAGDLEVLRSYYLDQGYIDFNINSTQVSITPDKRDIYITINISEGKQHHIEEVRLAGELILPAEELFPLVLVNPGDLFSRKNVTSTVERISKRLGTEGYAFANVNAIPKVDKESKQVTLTFFVDPGKRVYVRRVNMEGNTRTRDEVLRREIRQMEGGWFAGDKVERSRTRLNRLGYFEEVNVETPTVPGTTDQVDVNFSVTERPSGNLLFGLGFSQTSGLLINASVNQTNFLGSGNRVNLTFNNSQVNTNYAFSFLNPYYTIDGVSRGFGIFLRQTDAGEANLAKYTTDTYGFNLNYGIPLNEFDTVRFQLEFENLELKTTSFSPEIVNDFIADNGDTYDSVRLVGSWSHDTRNRAIFADRGMLQRVSAEVTVPGLDLDYFKLNYKNLIYIPLTRNLTLSSNLELGYGDGYNDLDELPFFKNFFAGGVRSVRGFEDNTLGPRDERNNPLGGALKTVGNVEIIFPPPFMPDSNALRMSGFFDIGNVFENVDEFDANELRYSIGIGATWLSPFGALSFSVAKPLNDESQDNTQLFQFTFGGQL
ncbi:MAG: outer membrane protein assembly factor BamA, partial [Gammaproteobacteria bacterium]